MNVFFSYAHQDEDLRDELAVHLAILERQGKIRPWHGRQITGGQEWAGSIVVFTTQLINDGAGTQLDNAGDEFVDDLPAELELIGASADSGTIGSRAGGPARGGATVTWNGSIAAGGTVTIVIEARIGAAAIGQTITNQGMIHYDADGDGINEASAPTQAPDGGVTSFVVLALIEIPAVSRLGLAVMALLLAGLALAALRRRTTG